MRRALFLVLLPVLLLGAVAPTLARVEIVQFDDPERQALYQEMIRELRCLVCQNQNLADSDADLARDLRRRTRELIEEGKERDEVVDYMVSRYGEFVLYRPRLTAGTIFLWFSPVVLFLFLVWWIVRWRRQASRAETGYSADELRRARDLLQDDGNHSRENAPR